MTALDPITGKNTQALPLDTNLRSKPIADAAKVRHSSAVPGSTDNDAESWRAHLQDTKSNVDDAVESFGSLPSAAGYATGKTALVDGQIYEITTHADANTLRLQAAAAIVGSYRGYAVSLPGTVGSDNFGEFLHDPVAADGSAVIAGLSSLRFTGQGDATLYVDAFVSASVARAAKGTALVDGDQYSLSFTQGSDVAEIRLIDSGRAITILGHSYIRLIAEVASYVGNENHADNAGFKAFDDIMASAAAFDLEISVQGGQDLVVDAKGWTERHDRLAQSNAQRIGALETAQSSSPHDDARLNELELKTGGITYDDDTAVWQEITDALNPGGANYGKFLLYAGARQVRNYVGGDYDSATLAYNAKFTVPSNSPLNLDDVGVIWVISNVPNWSKTRLAVRSASGELKQTILVGAMHTVSSFARGEIVNLPATNYTPLWIGHDDTHPEPFGHLAFGDTITMERLHPAHTPIWNDEIAGEWADRVAANEARLNVLFNSLHLDPAGRAPRTTLEITGETTWDNRVTSGEYLHRQQGMQDDDIIEVVYENLTVASTYRSYLREGSAAASGRFYLHYRDLRTPIAINGLLGFTTGLARTVVSGTLVDDPLGSNMEIYVWRTVSAGTPTLFVEALIRLHGPANEDATGQFPANFALTVRTWRS